MFQRSWQLFKASWGVLRADKKLALFPVLSTIATLLVIASFALPVWATHATDAGTGKVWISGPGYLLMGIGYFVLSYVTIFFNAALIFAANERITGVGPGTVGSGLRGAAAKAGAIAPWALISATVSLLLQSLEKRGGIFGRIAISLVGIAWSLVTYLVVPILVLEGGGAIESVKRSAAMFKRTWGENVVGNAGIGIVSLAGFLVAALVVGLGGALSASASPVLGVPVIVIGVVGIAAVIATSAALSGIYRVALYRYAADGVTPPAFGSIDLGQAFRQRRGGRGGFGGSPGFTGRGFDSGQVAPGYGQAPAQGYPAPPQGYSAPPPSYGAPQPYGTQPYGAPQADQPPPGYGQAPPPPPPPAPPGQSF